ncbi:metal-dependent hydrolase [Edaphobacter albus]|uniref:metal-dependent hydrolase n=1 Tax=Edaphobacter sp. 4G125 TaxID=2763071 RepID=UPI0016463052|nr:metal-dependent hydrolase [Edaphobacter sp. 4G125]QNI37314.1 metal-dependent hydrolase [Edaphobacter sp. 4G125]
MDPVTHFMTGAVLSRAGFNRKAAYATLAMTLAAEAPDLDVLWGGKGPVAAFEHHRGWTHTLVGIPFEAAVVVGVIWGGHRLLRRWRSSRGAAVGRASNLAPVRWGLLYLFSVIALLSHILLDWTNNYGVRLFFPFNPRWYAGSFVFIIEPVILLLLLIALVAPALFGLVSSEVGVRRRPYRGRGWAIAALVGIVAFWGWRVIERQKAIELTREATTDPIVRITADPYPINPFLWQTLVETPLMYQVSTVNLFNGEIRSSPEADVFRKPPTTLSTLVAKRSWFGRIYLDWSQYPLVNDMGADSDGMTTVLFRDLRFVYNTPIFGRDLDRRQTPLSGTVIVNDDRRVERMEMDGKVQQ